MICVATSVRLKMFGFALEMSMFSFEQILQFYNWTMFMFHFAPVTIFLRNIKMYCFTIYFLL